MANAGAPIDLEIQGEIAIVALNRPSRLNAIDVDCATALLRTLDEVADRDDVRVVLLTGRGRGFCAGVDLDCLDQIGEGRRWRDVGELAGTYFNPVIHRLASMPKVTFCYVNGVAAGAGASLAFACDFRLGAVGCSFVLAFSALGLAPDSGATFFLPRLIGHARALELAALGAPVDADRALHLGLLHWTAASPGMEDALVRAAQLARLPRGAFAATRQLMLASFESTLSQSLDGERQRLAELGRSSDHREGLMALRAKRMPQFRD